MAPKLPCAKYQYVVTAAGPKILPVEEPSCKDEESPADYNAGGYLPVRVNDTFKHGRYRVIRKLGWGHFSTVWLVKDTQLNRHSALKVVKSAGRYAETARDEIKLLSRVASFSPTHPGRSHIVSFLDSFSHQGPEASHVCIVFEPLGENLLALIERNKKKGVSRPLVKVVAKQILLGLQYLHDECDLVHTDIKPENILISIPDIEAHIYTELSQSPSPTSRRVGVPPTKTRSGVSIPLTQQRATRRQVQIFDSQPLASPGRSAGIRSSLSMSMSQGGSGGSTSGTNSVSSSYVAQMQLSKLSSANGHVPLHASGSALSLSSSQPKVPSGLSMSAPRQEPAKVASTTTSIKAVASASVKQANGLPNSPSTSSSSSSIASTSTSTGAASSSVVSTPPTSLSHSLGNVVAGMMGMTKSAINSHVKVDVVPVEDKQADDKEKERVGLPMKSAKGKTKEDDIGSSWKSPASWKDRMGFSLSSSHKSSTSSAGSLKATRQSGHSRSHSGISISSSWKDPGLAAPAPAVVVSAVVGADGEEESGDYFQNAGSSGDTLSTSVTKSESSSATVTVARPSPAETPRKPEAKSITRDDPPPIVQPVIVDAPSIPYGPALELDSASAGAARKLNAGNNPSLLSQTAPRTISTPTTQKRLSPPHHKSQLSAHMHTHPPPGYASPVYPNFSLDTITEQQPYSKTTDNSKISPSKVSISTSFLDTTPTASPAAPPPTPNPNTASSPTSLTPAPISITPHPSASLDPPIPIDDSPPTPPVSIKIADLGNATPSKKHYTEDIQTRQYRAPEAIIGRKDWDARADIWSVACVVFELLTAEYLFDPQGQGELFTKDDDHMAQIIELLGDFSMEAKMGGKYSRDLFDHTGGLRYIRTLKPWPLKRVMLEKYLYSEEDAASLCEFLEPMLQVDQKKRCTASDMVEHKWLDVSFMDEVVQW